MSNVMELSLRGASALEKLMRAVLLDSENKVPSERLRIVGAIADGAIMESGSNANGKWTRYADGTQICLINAVVPFSQNAISAYCTFTLPAAFANSNYRASCTGTRTEITYVVIRNKVVSSMEIVVSLKAPSASDVDLGVDIIAIGKWK